MPNAVIFGAGKIGRGFVGHLLFRSGFSMTFVDAAKVVVDRLNATGGYPLHVLGAADKDVRVTGVRALLLDDAAAVCKAVAGADVLFTSVGGPNLPVVGKAIAAGLAQRLAGSPGGAGGSGGSGGNREPLNIIICENYKDPAALLRTSIESALSDSAQRQWSKESLGIAETQVLRSCIEPSEEMKRRDPLSIQVQDWWVLPCDGEAIRGKLPVIEGLSLKANFKHELMRKVYTYNCSNATISYLGYLRGYTMLYEAANDAEILAVTQAVYDEGGRGLIAEFKLDVAEQKALQNLAITKYQDRKILDPIERNGRDSKRKLASDDRLMGPANLAVKHGVRPANLALAVAAALHYDGSDDPGTKEVQAMLRQQGLAATLRNVSGIEAGSVMDQLVRAALPGLARFNQRGAKLVTG